MNSLPPEQRTMVTQDVLGSKIEAIPGMGVCDFCTTTPVAWSYPCGLVILETPVGTHVSNDPWGACTECHDLIEAGDRPGLAERSGTAFLLEHGELPPEIVTLLIEVQASFFAKRLGDPEPV